MQLPLLNIAQTPIKYHIISMIALFELQYIKAVLLSEQHTVCYETFN